MTNVYDVVVVGGGIAGLTCAAFSCKYGFRTLLLEKSEKTGGLVNSFTSGGYTFDGGIRAFENTGIVLPMLSNLGIDIEILSNPISIGIEHTWARLQSKDSLDVYLSMLSDLFPCNTKEIHQIGKEIKKVMDYMGIIYGIDNPLLREDFTDKDYLLKTLLPWLIKYQMKIGNILRLSEPVNSYLKRFTGNQALIDMITQHFFKDTPTFFALSYFGLYLEYFYPKGGTGVLTQKITDYILTSGGNVITEAAVTKVDTEQKLVYVSDKAYSYKKMVWAANQKTLYQSIGKQNSVPILEQQRLVSESIGSDSILTLYLGVNKHNEYFQEKCGAHAFYTPSAKGLTSVGSWKAANTSKENLYDWVGHFLEATTYEISCPALRDSSLAPEGKTGIIISTVMDYDLVKYISEYYDYDVFKEYCGKKIIDAISQTLFPGVEDNIEFMFSSTPLTIEALTGNAHGAITGWSFTNRSMPSVDNFKQITKSIDTPIKDVYQCGQWTFSPSGLPVSILTGKVAADEIRKTLK